MMYTRAAASDYDDWEVTHGNVGWGSKDLIPLLKKVLFKLLSNIVCITNVVYSLDGNLPVQATGANPWIYWSLEGFLRWRLHKRGEAIPGGCTSI